MGVQRELQVGEERRCWEGEAPGEDMGAVCSRRRKEMGRQHRHSRDYRPDDVTDGMSGEEETGVQEDSTLPLKQVC